MNIPDISKLQYHPFSISSYWEDDPTLLTIHSKKTGSWTEKLHRVATEKSFIDMKIEGFYGCEPNIKNTDFFILIAGGIAITPLIPVIKSFLSSENKKPITLLWTFRNTSEYILFADVIRALSNQPGCQVKLFYTGKEKHSLPLEISMPKIVADQQNFESKLPKSPLYRTHYWVVNWVSWIVGLVSFFVIRWFVRNSEWKSDCPFELWTHSPLCVMKTWFLPSFLPSVIPVFMIYMTGFLNLCFLQVKRRKVDQRGEPLLKKSTKKFELENLIEGRPNLPILVEEAIQSASNSQTITIMASGPIPMVDSLLQTTVDVRKRTNSNLIFQRISFGF